VGNARYEGYSMDLIDEISRILEFKYEFELTPDQAYGSYNKETKQWNGLVKQLLDRVRLTFRLSANGEEHFKSSELDKTIEEKPYTVRICVSIRHAAR
jgi:hypothetical protein